MSLTWFSSSSIVLLLTKLDLFREKLSQSPIREYFPDYTGPDIDSSAGQGFFVKKFLALNRREGRQIHVFCTNVTHTAGFEPVLRRVMRLAISQEQALNAEIGSSNTRIT